MWHSVYTCSLIPRPHPKNRNLGTRLLYMYVLQQPDDFCLKKSGLFCSYCNVGSVQLPFLCTVCIGGMVYSSGWATTKKQAKHAAG